jgi:hypothetical protein
MIRVYNDTLYVLDKYYEKYISTNNKLFKAIFSNCPTFSLKDLLKPFPGYLDLSKSIPE